MKITKLKLFVLLGMVLFSLSACGNEKKDSALKNTENPKVSKSKDILKSLGLKNQNDINTRDKSLSINVLESSYMGASTYDGKVLEADNIFVATIEDMTTEYSDPIYDDENKLISSIPETRFKLKLLENLRGELPINTTIQAFRPYFGNGDGVEEGKFITLIEDDIIPEKGKTYIFLTRVVDGELIVPSGGEVPSNFPLENAPMDLDKQSEKVFEEVVETSSKVEEVKRQVRDEKQVYDEIGDTLLESQKIRSRLDGQGKKPDLSKIVSQ